MAAQSRQVSKEKKPGKKEFDGAHIDRFTFSAGDGLFEYLCRRYTRNRSLFSAEETAIYAAMATKGFN